MPFREVYRVLFNQGKLAPELNVLRWPDMIDRIDPRGDGESHADDDGLTITIGRSGGSPAVRHSVFVPSPLVVGVRLLTRVEFDLPSAQGYPEHIAGDVIVVPPDSSAHATVMGPPGHHDPGGSSPVHMRYTKPEPWAVGLNVSLDNNVSTTAREINVTCQFSLNPSGVRLNTTSGLQSDSAGVLEGPLDYQRYQRDGIDPPRLFFLEQSFCGVDGLTDRPSPGNGVLRITRGYAQHLFPDEITEDQRVFTHNVITSAPSSSPQLPTIGALGVSLITLKGYGQMSIRLRSFSVWLDGATSATNAPN